MNKYMKEAIKEAYIGIENNDGGPFGCTIVKNGKVIAKAHNKVLLKKDSTCHGEMEAIRKACKKVDSFDLSGCILYTTAEPCNMCLCACLWANIDKVYYGCTISDTESIGFRDKKFDKMFGKRINFENYIEEIDRAECQKLFSDYMKKNNTKY